MKFPRRRNACHCSDLHEQLTRAHDPLFHQPSVNSLPRELVFKLIQLDTLKLSYSSFQPYENQHFVFVFRHFFLQNPFSCIVQLFKTDENILNKSYKLSRHFLNNVKNQKFENWLNSKLKNGKMIIKHVKICKVGKNLNMTCECHVLIKNSVDFWENERMNKRVI